MSELMDFEQIKEVIKILDDFRCKLTDNLTEMKQVVDISASFYDDPVMVAASEEVLHFINRVSENKGHIDCLIVKLEEEMMGLYECPPKWD